MPARIGISTTTTTQGRSSSSVVDYQNIIQKALNSNRKSICYRVENAGPGKYTAEYGTANILCCFFARHYAYDITIEKDLIKVHSTISLRGFASGLILGMRQHHDETNAVRRRLRDAFPEYTVEGNHA